MDPYEALANAIIVQAASDYRSAHKKLKRFPGDPQSLRMIADCESFFLGDWISALTEVNGEFILRKLEEEVTGDDP